MCDGVRENPDPLPGLLQAAERLRSQPPQPRDGAASDNTDAPGSPS